MKLISANLISVIGAFDIVSIKVGQVLLLYELMDDSSTRKALGPLGKL